MRKYLRIIALSVLTSLILLSFNGCIRGPFRKPVSEKPSIPERISRGAYKEPQLTVYIADEKRTQKMNLEDYVAGVVAGEMKNDWPVEALAAQAIIARTYVLEFISSKGGSKYGNADISTDIEEAQAWNAQGVNDRIRKAVNMTRGKVAVYNGEYIKAWFHAHSGGTTAMAKEGLAYKGQEPPYIKSVKSPDIDAGPAEDRAWSAVFTRDEVRALLKDKLGRDVGPVESITIVDKGPSGRAVRLKVNGQEFSGPDFRIALGSTRMKSTLLTDLKIDGDKVVIKGKGYGHGVGMSQWGANAMAKQGKTPEEIVKFFFKDIDIVKLWR